MYCKLRLDSQRLGVDFKPLGGLFIFLNKFENTFC